MKLQKLKRISALSALSLTLLIIIFGLWLIHLNNEMTERIQGQWFLPPIEIYSAPLTINKGGEVKVGELTLHLERLGFRRRSADQRLNADDYALLTAEECQGFISDNWPEGGQRCLVWHKGARPFGPQREPQMHLVVLDEKNVALELFSDQPFKPTSAIILEPQLFAQFYEGQPILRQLIRIGDVPLVCLQAVTAIEDSRFLDHQGISLGGMARAFLRNLRAGRLAEGGSTITQQLIKNYFLTSERSFRRKFKEMFMALLLEWRLEKDQILENYLNVIYMGQNGPFQVRGYGAAAQHYFSQPLSNLDLAQCSLLAAIVNSPGYFNPFTQPERAKQRQRLVLNRMVELDMIDQSRADEAAKTPLPKRPPKVLSEPAPYFVQALHEQLDAIGINQESGLRIYTTLHVDAQEAAQRSVDRGLKELETDFKSIKEWAEKGKHLEAAIISVDLKKGGVTAMVGGRGYKKTQYNRATSAHRQVGSIMKPIVYLAALETVTPEGHPYTPLTAINDEPFTHSYQGQKWSPQNYDRKYFGTVPLFFALKNSLNAATAKLAIDVGLDSIVDLARRLGVESKVTALPSLSLGAFELYPIEVAQSYATIARLGSRTPLYMIERLEDFKGDVVFEHEAQAEQVVAKETASVLVGMMKQTLISGTGQSITQWRGFLHPAAGKTGTTSDTKDTWFSGFTPYVLSVVWVGYDDNTPTGLTGSSGAIPIWTYFMKDFATKYPADDFQWPTDSVNEYLLPKEQLATMVSPSLDEKLKDAHLIFRNGEEPGF